MSNNYYKYDFLFSALIIIILVILALLFVGTPDLMDAIISRINCSK